ncbi:hypothetical protein [Lacticaseibacillus paracasei]|uniref:hypothetical protein n=1 Tax=Lacticaseibacillus paracasei TaxID=1597 RepID=UPI001C039887|nr:hypothetical protein [Lacticaseibacillus paracasei]MBT9262346.1 hypothetical protein [Lacticaseibacillus paracasei]
MKRYCVYSGENGLIGSGLSYQEALELYKKECDYQQFEFEDDIGYDAMADPSEYSAYLMEQIAVSQPEEEEPLDGDKKFDSKGNKIAYYSWSGQNAPEAEK